MKTKTGCSQYLSVRDRFVMIPENGAYICVYIYTQHLCMCVCTCSRKYC